MGSAHFSLARESHLFGLSPPSEANPETDPGYVRAMRLLGLRLWRGSARGLSPFPRDRGTLVLSLSTPATISQVPLTGALLPVTAVPSHPGALSASRPLTPKLAAGDQPLSCPAL